MIIISFCPAGFSIVNAMLFVIKKSNGSLNFLPSIEATRWRDRQTHKMMENTGEGKDRRRLVGRGWDWGHGEDAAENGVRRETLTGVSKRTHCTRSVEKWAEFCLFN